MNRRTTIKVMFAPFVAGMYGLFSGRMAQAAQDASTQQASGEKAGTVLRVKGRAVAVLDAISRPLAPGVAVFIGDILSTGADARLEIKMIDDALFTLGERTSFNVFDYSFQNGATLNLVSGVLDGASGLIGKQNDRGITINTRLATIGIRGTKYWIGDMMGAFQVAHWSGGGVEVRTDAASVRLEDPKAGTIVRARNRPPTPPMPWGADRMSMAKKMVSF
ncbi:FecR family protein [Varunaivibrio sulfuroxidans]|nr:FecR domain-containing protein [Varunaivibrio sulfuroxidans]WES31144.1 FecR domain-containing protein [Varunaivibrio sulfuroxidans]